MKDLSKRPLTRRLAGLAALLLAGAFMPGLGGASAAPLPNGGFQIEGDLVATSPALDWQTADPQHATDGTGAQDPTVYQTSSKENDPVSTWVSGTGAPPGKSDIGNHYWFDQVVDSHQWGYFAWDREKGTGTEYYFLELNQKPNSTNDPARPDRTVGDVRLMVHDHGNGTIDIASVETWTSNGWADVEPIAAEAATNAAVIPAAGLPWGSPFADKKDGSLGPEQFIEMALDLTAMNLIPTCPAAFTTVNFRSVTGNAGKMPDGETEADFSGKNLKDFISPLTVSLDKCADLKILKYDSDGTTPLKSVQFTITPSPLTGTGSLTATDGAANDLKADGTQAAADGVIEFFKTVPGVEYTVHEVAAPTGYIADVDQKVTPAPYASVSVSFTNKHVLTDLAVKKVDAADATKVLKDAKFALWMESNGKDGLQMVAVGATPADTAVSGGTCTTAVDGTCKVTGLDFGTYYWQEVSPPPGYKMPVANVSAAIAVTPAVAGTTMTATVFQDEAQTGALAITKSNSPTETEALAYGETITYTLTVTATGDLTQENVVVTDNIPGYDASYPTSGKTTYVAGSGKCTSGATCTAVYDATNHLLTWAIGDMTAATPVTLTFQVTVDVVATTGPVAAETIWNAGAVKSDQTTIQPSNVVKNPVSAVLGEKFVKPSGQPSKLPFSGIPATLLVAVGLVLIGTGTLMTRVRLARDTG